MRTYNPFIEETRELLLQLLTLGVTAASIGKAERYLNGGPAEALRQLTPLKYLQEHGIFFTGTSLSKALSANLGIDEISYGVLDPACGGGDLLLACAKRLPISTSLKETLQTWGSKLFGVDIHQNFIELTKIRLILLAATNVETVDCTSLSELMAFLPNIIQGDCFDYDFSGNYKNIVVNPPFTKVAAPYDCEWSSGSTSSASLFIEKVVRCAPEGTNILAILPDVLRTGTRYQGWRNYIQNYVGLITIESFGLFDALTEVDVFIAHMKKMSNCKQERKTWWSNMNAFATFTTCVGDVFDVRVGAVVPFRHKEGKQLRPYIDVHDLPAWGRVEAGITLKGYACTQVVPPFVAVRRNSKSSDAFRAVATIVTGEAPVLVENHIITLKPFSGDLNSCEKLFDILHSEQTNNWLNERIRCRHLTVSALKSLPW